MIDIPRNPCVPVMGRQYCDRVDVLVGPDTGTIAHWPRWNLEGYVVNSSGRPIGQSLTHCP